MSSDRFRRDRESLAPGWARFQVAGIVVELRPGGTQPQWFGIPPFFAPFAGGGTPDLVLTYRHGVLPGLSGAGDLLFDESQLWSLHQGERGLFWRQPSISVEEEPSRAATFQLDLGVGEVYLGSAGTADGLVLFPLYHPLDRFVYDTLLGRRRGLGCHACGVDDGGRGLLFVGESGAGKSTLARLWHGRAGVTVLSDERTVLRSNGREWRIYGTPWHGTEVLFSPSSAPLSAIFFLRQGDSNRLAEVRPAEAVRRLLPCAYLPFWYPAGMEYALRCLDEVGQAVPCYELGFEAADSVVDFLRGL